MSSPRIGKVLALAACLPLLVACTPLNEASIHEQRHWARQVITEELNLSVYDGSQLTQQVLNSADTTCTMDGLLHERSELHDEWSTLHEGALTIKRVTYTIECPELLHELERWE